MSDETKGGGAADPAQGAAKAQSVSVEAVRAAAEAKGGSVTAAAVTVNEPGAGNRLAGPGTGRAVSQPSDARIERHTSFDPADFPALTGREEDWRFTPLKRLRGLHESPSADGKVAVDVAAPEPVLVETVGRDDARLGKAGAPVDRTSALAWAGFTEATVITVPQEAEVAEPVRVTLTGTGGTVFGNVLVDVKPFAKA